MSVRVEFPDEVEILNLDYSSEVDDNEWKCEKRRIKTKRMKEIWRKRKRRKQKIKLTSRWARDMKFVFSEVDYKEWKCEKRRIKTKSMRERRRKWKRWNQKIKLTSQWTRHLKFGP